MFKLLCVIIFATYFNSLEAARNIVGYHYEKPSLSLSLEESPSHLGHGSFGGLATVQPLPPLPALPPLPTPHSKEQFVQTQAIYQTHPAVSLKPLPSVYVAAPASNIGKIAQQYQPVLQTRRTMPSPVKAAPTGLGFASASTALGSNLPSPAPIAPQPLRVPFGKQAVIRFPGAENEKSIYEGNARQLKQYAVIEIIDNDIEQNNQPFLSSSFFENYRAHAGTGSSSTSHEGLQFGSRSSAALLGQQRLPGSNSDAVALGSGGLGFIRLANGNVYLGSGSLGYISGQQHNQELLEARTRSGASQPDALHFGHGPLGIASKFNKFTYRFK